MLKNYFIYFFLFAVIQINSQINIKGKITDHTQKSINSASIIIKDINDNILNYTISDSEGNYTTNVIFSETIIIVVNSINYNKIVKQIKPSNNNSLEFNFELSPKITEIKEVFLLKSKPITFEKDKIIFDAKSFTQGNEQVVEDLLKKIPGLVVTDDGTIKVGNQEVEKVMVDGDDFFEKGYKIVTKNMPVNPIDKVELLQKYSNNRLLKGIENSQKVALNLTLKDGYKRQWFGNVEVGGSIAPENRYELRANMMNFGKKNKFYFLSNFNNIGSDVTGNTDLLIKSSSQNEPSTIGDNQTINPLLNLDLSAPNLKQKRTNFNNAELFSLNSIFKINNKLKYKILTLINTDEIDFFRNSTQKYILENSTFTNVENFIGRKKIAAGIGRVDLQYDISENKSFVSISKFNKTDENKKSQLSFNNLPLSENSKNNNTFFSQKFIYTHQLKSNTVFLLTANYISEKLPQKYSVNNFTSSSIFENVVANNTFQLSNSKMQFAGFEGHLINRKKNNNLLEIRFGNRFRKDELQTSFEINNDDNVVLKPSTFQNDIVYNVNDLYLLGKYKFQFDSFSVFTQSEIHQINSSYNNDNITYINKPFYIVPRIGIEWKLNDRNKLQAFYFYNTTNSKILNVYNNFVQTGYRSFTKGLDQFNQLNSSSANLNYALGNWGNKFFANASFQYTKNHDFYSNNSVITQNLTLSEALIIKNSDFVSFNSDINNYVKPLKSNFKLILGGSSSTFKNIVNDSELREIKSTFYDYGFELRSSFKGIFNYHIGSKWNSTIMRVNHSQSFTNNYSFLDLFFLFNDKLNVEIKSEHYHFGNLKRDKNNYMFSDIYLRYNILENKFTASAIANNLFNTKTYNDYMISDTAISNTEYKLLPRYFLLKLEYRF